VELTIHARYYHGREKQRIRIYHCPGFSRTAQATIRLIAGWCSHGSLDRGHWDAIFYYGCEKPKVRLALDCILRDQMNSATFFTQIKKSFASLKSLEEKELMISQLNEFGIKMTLK
jgi:hypothetical protein